MALIDITPREAESLFDRLDSWYQREQAGADDASAASDRGSGVERGLGRLQRRP